MHQAPKETVDSWLRQPALDPLRLVPSLLQLQHAARDPLAPNHAVRYLTHAVFEQHSTSATIHNLLITFYVAPSAGVSPGLGTGTDDDGALLRFLAAAPTDAVTGRPYYDIDYALRLCKRTGRTQPCVHIYAKMGLWENSVDLALEKGDLELAKAHLALLAIEDVVLASDRLAGGHHLAGLDQSLAEAAGDLEGQVDLLEREHALVTAVGEVAAVAAPGGHGREGSGRPGGDGHQRAASDPAAAGPPAGTPAAIVAKLNAAINESLTSPEIGATLTKLNVDAKTSSPEEFAAFLARERDKWTTVIKTAGVQAE